MADNQVSVSPITHHERRVMQAVPMTETEDPILWLDKYELVARANNWTPATQLEVVGSLLPPTAIAWYNEFRPTWKTYDDFKAAFEECYQTPSYIMSMRMLAQSYRQGRNESVNQVIATMGNYFRCGKIEQDTEKQHLLLSALSRDRQIPLRVRTYASYRDLVARVKIEESARQSALVSGAPDYGSTTTVFPAEPRPMPSAVTRPPA
ncbi:hypothetical protein BGW41_008173, partial [Actinomortierella wolfii]